MQNEQVEVTEADREYALKCRWVETTVDDLDYLAGLFAEVRIAAEQAGEKRGAERERAAINIPITDDFMAGVPLEAAHQRARWGVDHDAGKSPFDWFWLIGYLAQKAADAAVRGDTGKALHHTISTAAALANWHAAIAGTDTRMRPGINTADAIARGEHLGG